MWYRLLMGAAVGSCVLLWLERAQTQRLVAGWHRADDPETAIGVIGDELAAEYARSGIESRCCTSRGVAWVQTTRRAHQRINLALRTLRTPGTSVGLPDAA